MTARASVQQDEWCLGVHLAFVILLHGNAVRCAEKGQTMRPEWPEDSRTKPSNEGLGARHQRFRRVPTTHFRSRPLGVSLIPAPDRAPFPLLTVRRSPAVWAPPAAARTPGWAAPPPPRCAWPPAPPCAPSPPGHGSGSLAGRPRTGRCRRPAGPVGMCISGVCGLAVGGDELSAHLVVEVHVARAANWSLGLMNAGARGHQARVSVWRTWKVCGRRRGLYCMLPACRHSHRTL